MNLCTLLVDGRVCGRGPARRLLAGFRCARHTPPQPDPASSLPDRSPVRPTPTYGDARTDPIGRDPGNGWHYAAGKRYGIPVKDREAK